jgi:hypothetical protein
MNSISILRQPISPTAVAGLVVSVVVLAINCCAHGALAHVADEYLERLPLRADQNPATSVPWVRMVSWITASAKHAAPRSVGSCSVHAVRGRNLLAIATARSAFTSSQLIPSGLHLVPAVAAAQPRSIRSTWNFNRLTDHDQTSESLAG